MKLLIDIPEHIYEHAKETTEDSRDEGEAMRAIANGTQQESRSEIPNKWIPVSERLPEKRGDYLVTQKAIFPGHILRRIVDYAPNLHDEDEYEFKGKKRPGWYDYDIEWGYYEIDGVVAWMPLPQPYKAESEE